MPLTYAQLEAMLDIDEPDYPALALAAAGAMRHLRKMAASSDPRLASKAVSLAGMIGDEAGVGVVGDAARSKDPVVRVAAAHAAAYLPDTASAAKVISRLLGDADLGVVKLAARASSGQSDRAMTATATRAQRRLDTAARAAAKGAKTMPAKKATAKKAVAKKATARKATAGKAAGGMPTGAMVDPPKGARAGRMPDGKMR
jgi:hypothetical protein